MPQESDHKLTVDIPLTGALELNSPLGGGHGPFWVIRKDGKVIAYSNEKYANKDECRKAFEQFKKDFYNSFPSPAD